MTFEQNTPTTLGQAFVSIHDNIASLTEWTIVDTRNYRDGLNFGEKAGSEFIFEHNLGDGQWRFRYQDNSSANDGTTGRFRMWWGNDWTATEGTWDDYDESHDRYNPADFGNNQFTAHQNGGNMDYDEAVEFTMEYVERGFVVGIERKVGDGADDVFVFGLAEIDPLFDFYNAAAWESRHIWGLWSRDNSGSFIRRFQVTGSGNPNQSELHQRSNYIPGQGFINPDANFDNFIYVGPVVFSGAFTQRNGDLNPIGTHDLWLSCVSSGRAHGDTYQDGQGNDIYYQFDAGGAYVAMRMD